MKISLKALAITLWTLLLHADTSLGQERTVSLHNGMATAGPDSVLMTLRELVIPQSVGTEWHYQYMDENGEFVKTARWGFHIWTLTSRSTTDTDTTLQIRDIESDSVQIRGGYPFPPATYQVDTVSFTVVISTDSIMFNLPEPKVDAFAPIVPRVARYSLQESDTLSMQIGDGYRGAIVKYANHIGFIEYAFRFFPGITTAFTQMNLLNYVPIVNSAFQAVTPMPAVIVLSQNFPNPFNPATTIRYALKTSAHVILTVFNLLGQQVATLVSGVEGPGAHEVKFDGSNLSSGVYFYRLQAGGMVQTKKLEILR